MDKAALQARLSTIDKRYGDLSVELHRLEGEYRAMQNLINELEADSPSQEESSTAQEGEVVDAEAQ